jgi:hypothetical protein
MEERMIRVRLKQHYIDARLHLFPEQEYDVEASLAAFLLGHRMAEKVEQPAVVEQAQPEPEEAPQPKRGKRGKQ